MIPGQIIFADAKVECTIRNISSFGASIEPLSLANIPDQFVLLVSSDRKSYGHRLRIGDRSSIQLRRCRRRERREAAAKRRLADEYDAAQERGEVAKSGDASQWSRRSQAERRESDGRRCRPVPQRNPRSPLDPRRAEARSGLVRRLALPFRRIGVRFGLRWLCAAYRIGRREGALKTLA